MNHLAGVLRARFNPKGLPSPVQLSRRFKRLPLIDLYAEAGFQRGAEVGVCTGLFSQAVCERVPTLQQLFCVDPWKAFDGNRPNGWGRKQAFHDRNYMETVERLHPYAAAQIVRAESLAAAPTIPERSLDFVYIDGNHRFDFVMQDLIAWGSRVRSGGIVSGDDYYVWRGHEKGVVLAVDAYVAAHGITEFYVCGDRSHSFFWVQP
jgi:hypothetical protein